MSEKVLNVLGAYTSGTVTRIAGADRWETAALLASSFTKTGGTLFVASGQTYPDALAASAIAAHLGVPLMLVSQYAVPPAEIPSVQRLDPARVILVAGPAAATDDVVTQLRNIAPHAQVERVAGADRYATSAEVAKVGYQSTGTVYVASGETFPDALSGSPAAANANAPILLVPSGGETCPPTPVVAEADQLGATSVIVLGGPANVNDQAAALQPCLVHD